MDVFASANLIVASGLRPFVYLDQGTYRREFIVQLRGVLKQCRPLAHEQERVRWLFFK